MVVFHLASKKRKFRLKRYVLPAIDLVYGKAILNGTVKKINDSAIFFWRKKLDFLLSVTLDPCRSIPSQEGKQTF